MEAEEVDNAQIESSGEEESLEKASEPSQLTSELQAPTPLLASSPEPPSSMPPAADVLVTQVTCQMASLPNALNNIFYYKTRGGEHSHNAREKHSLGDSGGSSPVQLVGKT